MDSDMIVRFLNEILDKPIPEDLPTQISYDKETLIEQEILVIFLLLESLKMHNIRRLLERGKKVSESEKVRKTRKNLKDLLSSICQIMSQEKVQFKEPFAFYSNDIASTVFNNFSMHLSFLLLKDL